ncbi:hypothetical protein EW145_g5764 [Phellinidium pouzarii]|uniref:Uncharacterized protein n=1 Tax=Phellinidium pouzarii TaxID=167371 RepID=A0A4S4KYV3_9AGAM|nr:hypothetical protein EW145_g5764 [Phellinidium pouzarii]
MHLHVQAHALALTGRWYDLRYDAQFSRSPQGTHVERMVDSERERMDRAREYQHGSARECERMEAHRIASAMSTSGSVRGGA